MSGARLGGVLAAVIALGGGALPAEAQQRSQRTDASVERQALVRVRPWKPGTAIILFMGPTLAVPDLDRLEPPETVTLVRRMFALEQRYRDASRAARAHARGSFQIPTARRARLDREAERLKRALEATERDVRRRLEQGPRGVHAEHVYALMLVREAENSDFGCDDDGCTTIDYRAAVAALERGGALATGELAGTLAYFAAYYANEGGDHDPATRARIADNYRRALNGPADVAAAAQYELGRVALDEGRHVEGIAHLEAALRHSRVARAAAYTLFEALWASDCAGLLGVIARARPRFEMFEEYERATELAASCVADRGLPLGRARALDPEGAETLERRMREIDADAPAEPKEALLWALQRCASIVGRPTGVVFLSGRFEAPTISPPDAETTACMGRHMTRLGARGDMRVPGVRGKVRFRVQVEWSP